MKTRWLIVVVLTGALLQVLSVLLTRGGAIHPECETFHVHLLSPGPLAKKVFDPVHMEFGLYQARELSYVIDWLDYRFIDFTIRNAHCYYVSLSSVLCFYLTGLLLWAYYAKELGFPPIVAYGAALLFWTSPPVFLGVEKFRSSKPFVMLLLAVSVFLLTKLTRHKARDGRYAALLAALFLALNTMGLFDRQGYFAVCSLFVISVFMFVSVRDRTWAYVSVVCLITVVLNNIYNYAIAPELIHRLNGYSPNFDWQSNSFLLKRLLSRPYFFLIGIFGLIAGFRCLVWDLPPAICLAILPFVWYRLRVYRPVDGPAEKWPANLTILITFIVYILYVLVYVRHAAVFKMYDVSRSLYHGPTMVLLLFLLPLAWRRLGIESLKRPGRRLLIVLTCLLVANNLLGCCEFRFHSVIGHMMVARARSKNVIRGLNVLFATGQKSDSLDVLSHPIYHFYLREREPGLERPVQQICQTSD